MASPPRRLLLKMSGEALASKSANEVLDPDIVNRFASELAHAVEGLGIELGVVIGGGNIWRGDRGAGESIERSASDTMGMLATVINALALQDAIEKEGRATRVMTAIPMDEVAEPYIRRRAVRHLEKGRIIILAAGMGNPYFTTDTSAALRAAELGAGMLLKGTHSGVDGVYSSDPRTDPSAVRYAKLSFMDLVNRDLKVMDLTAITFCRDNDLAVLVFDMSTPGNLAGALAGEEIGTLIR